MTDKPQRRNRSTEAFFGRRRGKTVRAGQAVTLAAVLPALKLDLSRPAPDDLATLWPAPVTSMRIEIGFGGGEHLLAEAARLPRTGFIGVEPFVNGMAKFVRAYAADPLGNIRVHDDDATAVLDWLPQASVEGVDLLYPDPWRKRRHWKRRFVNPANLDRFSRILKPGGLFRFASDFATYVDWTLLACRDHPDFVWTAERSDDWRRPYAGWPGTRYEAKALREGRMPAYLAFRRV